MYFYIDHRVTWNIILSCIIHCRVEQVLVCTGVPMGNVNYIVYLHYTNQYLILCDRP